MSRSSSYKGKEKAVRSSSDETPESTSNLAATHSSSDSSQSSDSDSDSDTTSSGASDSDTDSDFGEVSPEYLESLLEKARASMDAKAKAKAAMVGGEEEEIRLPGGSEQYREFPPLDPGKVPPPYFEFGTDKHEGPSTVRDVDTEKLNVSSKSLTAPEPAKSTVPQLGKDGKPMTKRQMKAERKKAAGPGYFDLPTPDAADLPRLYREVEALRLRNMLDPKRFYRKEGGEGKGIKGLPKQFAIGTIIPTSTPFGTASGDNLARAERKRTLVDELVDDSEAKRYAKKKFDELQSVRAARGRGTFAKRFASRRPKW